jgi:hypothetical protein
MIAVITIGGPLLYHAYSGAGEKGVKKMADTMGLVWIFLPYKEIKKCVWIWLPYLKKVKFYCILNWSPFGIRGKE